MLICYKYKNIFDFIEFCNDNIFTEARHEYRQTNKVPQQVAIFYLQIDNYIYFIKRSI